MGAGNLVKLDRAGKLTIHQHFPNNIVIKQVPKDAICQYFACQKLYYTPDAIVWPTVNGLVIGQTMGSEAMPLTI